MGPQDLMANLKTFKQPQFPSKDFQKRLDAEYVKVFLVRDQNGQVTDVELREGPRPIMPYLVNAIRRWRFEPFALKGRNIPVIGEMKINL